jgi:predicted metal-dependent hydrolase
MLSNLISRFRARQPVAPEALLVGSRTVPLLMVRNPRARRYLLRVRPDGSARVTIPRGGSQSEAQSFVERNRGWLEQQLARLHAQPRLPVSWPLGSAVLFRGEMVRIEAGAAGGLQVGTEHIKASRAALGVPPAFPGSSPTGAESLTGNDANPDLRPAIERHFRALASAEFPARVAELAAQHQFTVRRVTVRNQKSRWGSCSRRGTISLNWRLLQTPPFVLDYLILHELAHLRHLNHSHRFWQEVERLCPDYCVAEQWLKTNRQLLR